MWFNQDSILSSNLSGKLLILQRWRLNEHNQRIAEQIGVLAIVEPELHLIEVGGDTLQRPYATTR